MPEPVEGTFSLLISVPEPVEGRSYSSLWFRLRSITVLFITTLGAWAESKAHYFYCIKIRALYRTSLMFLWELKNAIISQNLRELCVIKINTNIPHIVASTSSATNSFITRCLSLSKAHYFYCIKIRVLYRTSLMFLWELKNAIISQNLRGLCVIKANTNIPHIVASTSSATNYFITRCLSLLKAHSHFSSRCLSLLKAPLFLLY